MIRLYNEDSLEFVKKLADGNLIVDAVITDPPYDFNEETKLKLQEQFLRLCRKWIIVFSPPENPWVLPANQYLYWIKPISTKNTSKSYSRFVEQIFVYGNGTWNSNRHWSQYTNVFTDLVDNSKLHPYRKPPSLIERLILNHTNENDLVFDPFGGSFSVAEVCHKTKRNYIGIEKEGDRYKCGIENLKLKGII
jgi:DNA modification methylase